MKPTRPQIEKLAKRFYRIACHAAGYADRWNIKTEIAEDIRIGWRAVAHHVLKMKGQK